MSEDTTVTETAAPNAQEAVETFSKEYVQELRNEAGEGRDIFDRSTRAAVDWAAATGGDAADAAEKLGKLLVNPEQANLKCAAASRAVAQTPVNGEVVDYYCMHT